MSNIASLSNWAVSIPVDYVGRYIDANAKLWKKVFLPFIII